jgi:hypothetical protein
LRQTEHGSVESKEQGRSGTYVQQFFGLNVWEEKGRRGKRDGLLFAVLPVSPCMDDKTLEVICHNPPWVVFAVVSYA